MPRPSGRGELVREEFVHELTCPAVEFGVLRLPPCVPDLNPVEAVWSLVRRAMAHTAFTTPDDLDRKLRSELRRIQLRPRLIDGCLTATRLAINPPNSALKTSVTDSALQDKFWVHGPGKEPWEVYVVKADAGTFGKSAEVPRTPAAPPTSRPSSPAEARAAAGCACGS
ncbi:hypothetical protein ACFYXX_34765 [Streptomyces sp. NPDC002458]|uniref:hypothetical protein n=1 Tax=Streptomyces sp. NPDC002458 TaxID=3364644 RepID=UPI0036CC3A8C